MATTEGTGSSRAEADAGASWGAGRESGGVETAAGDDVPEAREQPASE
jgi:hypothetical protein